MARNLALTTRFLCELGMIAALAYWGFGLTDSTITNILLGIGAPLAAAVIWGIFLSPKRRVDAPLPIRVGIELVVFAVAVVALVSVGQVVLAVVLAVAVLAQRATLSILGIEGDGAYR